MVEPTAVVRLSGEVVREVKTLGLVFSGKSTPGEVLAEAWYEYLRDHDVELDRLEDEARAKRKEMMKRAKPKPDGGKTYA